jgi:hypothetical protein
MTMITTIYFSVDTILFLRVICHFFSFAACSYEKPDIEKIIYYFSDCRLLIGTEWHQRDVATVFSNAFLSGVLMRHGKFD